MTHLERKKFYISTLEGRRALWKMKAFNFNINLVFNLP